MRAAPVLACLLLLAGVVAVATAQQVATIADEGEARAALIAAQRQGAIARGRAELLEQQVAQAGAEADRTAQQAAAAAARIQETQAEIAARRADLRLIDQQRDMLRARLAERQTPVLRLTAALERLSRRPLAVAMLRPGSLRDTVHMRAMLDTMLPEVRNRTMALRGEIDRGRVLSARMQASLAALREQQSELDRRRQSLAALETRQRLDLRMASGGADSEAERALALAEQARDLDALTGELSRAGALRTQLMQLPGPVLRPADPRAAQGLADDAAPAAPVSATAPAFILPVQGRLIAGFGGMVPGMPASRGIMLGASSGAQAIAPGAGRIAFAGPYRGYGTIVIIDHGNGWTSLVTGLAQLEVRVGQDVLAGSPIGAAGPVRPVISLEIRHQGQPVNPLDLARF